MNVTFTITPHLLEQVIASGIVIAMLVTLAFVVIKVIGE